MEDDYDLLSGQEGADPRKEERAGRGAQPPQAPS